ncbi:MAG: ABC transporter permease [Rhodospirillales bacterium]
MKSAADSAAFGAAAWRRPPARRAPGDRDPWRLGLLAAVTLASLLIGGNLLFIFWTSILEGSVGGLGTEYSVAAYREVFTDPFVLRVFANTTGFAAVTLVVSLAFGIPIAWLATRTDVAGKPLIFTMMTVAVLIPGFIPAIGWVFLLHPTVGLVNSAIEAAFGAGTALSINNIVGMGWVQGLSLAPLAFIMTASAFRAMDPALEEAAAMAGANPLTTFFTVTLRLAWPAIMAASIFIFTIGFAAVDTPAIIGWGRRIFTYSTYVLVLLNPTSGPPQYGAAAATSAPLVIWALAMCWLYNDMQKRARRYAVITGKGYRPMLVPLGRLRWLAVGFVVLFFLLNFGLPLIVLVWAALLPFIQLPTVESLAMLSLENFRSIDWGTTLTGLKNTAILTVSVATVVTVLSFAFSWVVLRSNVRGRAAFDVFAFLPHVVPATLFSISSLLIGLFVIGPVVPIYGTLWILIIASVVVRISYGSRMTNSALIQIHRELDEAAQMSGATTGDLILRVLLPLMAPALLFTWLWTALLTSRDLTVVMFLTTGGNLTLPYIVWSNFAFGQQGAAAVLSLLLLAVTLPLIFVYAKALDRWKLI